MIGSNAMMNYNNEILYDIKGELRDSNDLFKEWQTICFLVMKVENYRFRK